MPTSRITDTAETFPAFLHERLSEATQAASRALDCLSPTPRGTRHTGPAFEAFLWSQSLVVSTEQPRVLFELDGAMQAQETDNPAWLP